jgi:hypothetical protein
LSFFSIPHKILEVVPKVISSSPFYLPLRSGMKSYFSFDCSSSEDELSFSSPPEISSIDNPS